MGKIEIRNVTPDDAAELLEIYAPYVRDTVISFEYEVPPVEEFRCRIEERIGRYPYIAAVENEKIAGYAYAGPFVGREAYDWSCELTVYVDRSERKKGLGKLLYGELERRLGTMGIRNLYACIGWPEQEDEYLTRNSAEFHEHLGFREVGHFRKCGSKFGRWYDMIWMEKIIGGHEENPRAVDWTKSLG